MRLRRLLHASGLRYRAAYPVPGLPRRSIDIAFPGPRVALFVDGCFWHGCPEHGVHPRANAQWWRTKLSTNQARDASTTAALLEQGWAVLRVWEHESPDNVQPRVLTLLSTRV
jgi:DNA mismatch endonuclease (patch repair protein)